MSIAMYEFPAVNKFTLKKIVELATAQQQIPYRLHGNNCQNMACKVRQILIGPSTETFGAFYLQLRTDFRYKLYWNVNPMSAYQRVLRMKTADIFSLGSLVACIFSIGRVVANTNFCDFVE
jgi:hypothetical protein